jgi:hypothetical protein
MVGSKSGLPFRRAREFEKRTLLQACIASALAAGMVISASADARTAKIQILDHAIAFGGHSFPGIGQYEVITGIASGEVDPGRSEERGHHRRRPREGPDHGARHVPAHLLHPEAGRPWQGQPQDDVRAAEPRGKTYEELNNTPHGGNDPAALNDTDNPGELDNSYLWTRGYTTVWSGWENDLGSLTGLTATAALPVAHEAGGAIVTGPAYEYIVTGGSSFGLTYPAASTDTTKAGAALRRVGE